MNCPKCKGFCERDDVDIGVGVIYGPYGCPGCGWSENPEYDHSQGPSPAQLKAGPDRYVDQFGESHSVERIAEDCARFGFPKEVVKEAFNYDRD